jgi:hypothetical protein
MEWSPLAQGWRIAAKLFCAQPRPGSHCLPRTDNRMVSGIAEPGRLRSNFEGLSIFEEDF